MRLTARSFRWFVLWSLAFYATAYGYVLNARGAAVPALAATLFAVVAISCCLHTAMHGDPPA